jgi:hypothetical protein
MKHIHARTDCPYCGHQFEDADQGEFVLITKARFDWLVSGAQQNEDAQGDDTWVDWMSEGEILTKLKE